MKKLKCAILDDYQNIALKMADWSEISEQVLVLPHLGYVSERNYRTYFSEAVENIQAYLAGAPIRKLN